MMLLGWVPLAILAPFFGPVLAARPVRRRLVRARSTTSSSPARSRTGRGSPLARTLPVAVSSMSSLPVPIVGVFSGMLLLGERPGPAEWIALALVVAAMVAVLWTPKPASSPPAPDN